MEQNIINSSSDNFDNSSLIDKFSENKIISDAEGEEYYDNYLKDKLALNYDQDKITYDAFNFKSKDSYVKFVRNNSELNETVFNVLVNELTFCSSFCLSVAFINLAGIVPLIPYFELLRQNNIKGKIITTDYLDFTEPKALDCLARFENIELKIFDTNLSKKGFHTKGYIFRNINQMLRFIIGSSNLTQSALKSNHEWNVLSVQNDSCEAAKELLKEFDEIWNSGFAIDYSNFIEQYRIRYDLIKKQKELALNKPEVISARHIIYQPNDMQKKFSDNLQQLLKEGKKRALLISATGTGKTYASGFALRDIGFDRALFVVHREQILKQAKASYQNIFGDTKTYGFLCGSSKEYNADITFATIQTISQSDELEKFAKDAFDIIVVDETHHVAATSYQILLDYFEPKKLCLGMTASPDRPDGFDIYKFFDHNIACEIRLQDALDYDLLCPFNYFGVTDFNIENVDPLSDDCDFNRLYPEARVKHIIKQAELYGYSGKRVKGLIFVSTIKEAEALSEKFNEQIKSNGQKYKTIALSGSDSQEDRESCIKRLTRDEELDDNLDYIISVDIFNEGVDIPEVNQVILLRPTQSSIVFVQQLGRGLRKSKDKDFIVVIDFIGEYKSNFLIPIALSGDVSYSKEYIRKFVLEGSKYIKGASTIYFDKISKEKIFKSIDGADFSMLKFLKEKYQNLKNKLGRIPNLMDFEQAAEIDVLRFMDSREKSYYKFLVDYEDDYKIRLSSLGEKMIEFVSQKLAKGKRIYELDLLKLFIEIYSNTNQTVNLEDYDVKSLFEKRILEKYKLEINSIKLLNMYRVLTNQFASGTGKVTYSDCIFLKTDINDVNSEPKLKISDNFKQVIQDKNFANVFNELIDFGINRFNKQYSKSYKNTDLVLYERYSYEDVCWLLNWGSNQTSTIFGYKYHKLTKTLPIFVNYSKSGDISDTIKYEDHFINPMQFQWISKNGRTLNSDEIKQILKADINGDTIHLFVRKNTGDKNSKEFYYLGIVHPVEGSAKEIEMKNTGKTAVEFLLQLEHEVRKDIYDYLTLDDLNYDNENLE